ncbi:MAG: LamG-like jellyroll fold domain-containing protein [Armatimonadota bacterium]
MNWMKLFSGFVCCAALSCHWPAQAVEGVPRTAAAWVEQDGWLGGQASGEWTYRVIKQSPASNYVVNFDLRIDSASSCRQPAWESAGWVWAKYGYNSNIGGYEAGVLLRRKGEQFYRVMFSAAYGEVLLWSPRGGFLQVMPWPIKTGQVYRVSAAVQGPHVTVTIDDKPVIDYWDRTAPLGAGGAALGVHEGAAFFRYVRVSSLPAFAGAVPPHAPNFRFRDWHGAKWAWDGNEPIFLSTGCYGQEAKLVPGYRAQLNTYWYWINYGGDTFYANKLKEFNVKEEGDRLRFELVATDKGEKTWLTGRTDVTLTYDAAKNRYIFDHVSDLIVPDGHKLGFTHPVEYTDPVMMGHVGSASTHGAQWETPHPWSVYQHVSGALFKLPHNHADWFPGYNEPVYNAAKGQYLAPKGGFWALVGDPVANPVFTVQDSSMPDSTFHTELCGWGFDVHMQWYPIKTGGTLGPGAYRVKWQLTAVDGKQGDAWLAQAAFPPTGKDMTKKLLVYTGGVGHLERFDKAVPHASPFGEYPWGDASLQDTRTGHGDSKSLKLVGPRSAATTTGASQYTEPVEPDTLYEVSAWVKTKDARGEGPGMEFGGQIYVPRITGTTNWRKIGFICKPNLPLYIVPIRLFNSGSGTVWFDDFRIRPLKKGEQPKAPIASGPQPVAKAGTPPGRMLTWGAGSDARDVGRTVLDLSGHGNHGWLEGPAAMADDNGESVIEVDGKTGYATGGFFSFAPPQSFAIWLQPGKQNGGYCYVLTGGDWRRAWTLCLVGAPGNPHLEFRPWGRHFVLPQVIPPDTWTHLAIVDDGKTFQFFLNGVKAEAKGEDKVHNNWDAMSGPLVLGNRLDYGKPSSSGYTGRMIGCGYWNMALDVAAIKALFDQGPQWKNECAKIITALLPRKA